MKVWVCVPVCVVLRVCVMYVFNSGLRWKANAAGKASVLFSPLSRTASTSMRPMRPKPVTALSDRQTQAVNCNVLTTCGFEPLDQAKREGASHDKSQVTRESAV